MKIKAPADLRRELLEVYAYRHLRQVLQEQKNVDISTYKIETLLSDILEALGGIDMSIDYLTAAVTGNNPASISIAQRVVGRRSGGPSRVSSLMPSQAAIKEAIEEVLAELNPNKTLAAQEPEDFEEPEEDPDALRADTILGGAPGEWQAAKDAETPPRRRPPKEYRREAIKLLASFNVQVGPAEIDVVAWQLYNNAQEGPTQPMKQPPGKLSVVKRGLKKLGLAEINQGDLSTIRYFTEGLPYEVEAMLIGLVDKHGFTIEDIEVMANELRDLRQGELDPTPQRRIAEKRLREYVEEEFQTYLDEVYSKKQRDFMCAMKDTPAGERPESLSQGEAEHLCSAPMEKPKKRKAK